MGKLYRSNMKLFVKTIYLPVLYAVVAGYFVYLLSLIHILRSYWNEDSTVYRLE